MRSKAKEGLHLKKRPSDLKKPESGAQGEVHPSPLPSIYLGLPSACRGP